MKITFNGVGCGFGNHGGTQTIYRMAAALTSLGNEVEVWSDSPNQFTWFPLDDKVEYKVLSLKDAPAVDVLISVGCATIKGTFDYPKKQVGVNWVRGLETWVMGEHNLIRRFLLPMPTLTNSVWLKKFIERRTKRKDIGVVYAGIPLHEFYNVPTQPCEKMTIGCLYSKKSGKRWKDFLLLMSLLGKKEYNFVSFGDGNCSAASMLDYYVKSPSPDQKRKFYSMCDIWFAPSNNEGLHIPPMEAALCGALVVGNVNPSAGLGDTCVHGESAMLFETVQQVPTIIKTLRMNPEHRKKLNKRHQQIIREKIGTVEQNAEKFDYILRGLLDGTGKTTKK